VEAAVWQVDMLATLDQAPVEPGIFVNGDTMAVLSVEHAPGTGQRFYELTVQGKDLAAVRNFTASSSMEQTRSSTAPNGGQSNIEHHRSAAGIPQWRGDPGRIPI